MKFEGNHELPSLELIEDEGILKIWGRSIMMEPKDFWQPLYEKMDVYLEDPRDIVISIDLEFFNTPTAKKLLDLLNLLKVKTDKNKRKLLIKWFYEDEDIKEAGEDYQSMITNSKWKFIEKENGNN